MKKILAIAALVLIASTGMAHAATLDIWLGSSNNSDFFTSGGTLTANVNLASPPPPSTLDLTNNSFIVSGSVPSNWTQPTGGVFGGNYLAVKGTGNPGSALFTLGPNNNLFGFTAGTIDTYNSLLITDSLGHTFSFTGADLLAHIGNPVAGSSAAQADIIFKDPFGSIVSAALKSSHNSFEAANFFQAHMNMPLPASFPLFAAALIGLFFMGRRYRAARN